MTPPNSVYCGGCGVTIASALPSLAPAEDQHPAFLLVAILAGLYSTYLFRGGRFVIWFW